MEENTDDSHKDRKRKIQISDLSDDEKKDEEDDEKQNEEDDEKKYEERKRKRRERNKRHRENKKIKLAIPVNEEKREAEKCKNREKSQRYREKKKNSGIAEATVSITSDSFRQKNAEKCKRYRDKKRMSQFQTKNMYNSHNDLYDAQITHPEKKPNTDRQSRQEICQYRTQELAEIKLRDLQTKMESVDNLHIPMNQINEAEMINSVNNEANKTVIQNNIIVQIKPENINCDDIPNECIIGDNPFENLQLEIKNELADDATEKVGNRTEEPDSVNRQSLNTELQTVEDVKQENAVDDSVVSYDYPNFDDGGSMDSNEATALGNVEACLQDDVGIKTESYGILEESKIHVKDEPELTVTDTHLIRNKVTSTTSTITSAEDGFIHTETNEPIVMDVHPVLHSGAIPVPPFDNPEEILPTTYTSNDDPTSYDDMFQLNSITGNELSLEQEAYGLLRAKRKKDLADKEYACPKCPKVCKNLVQYKRHVAVHKSIDKRAKGFLKGLNTRIKNRQKKLEELDDELEIGNDEPDAVQDNPVLSGRKMRMDNRNKRRGNQEGGLNYKGVKKRQKKYKDDPDEKFSIRIRSKKEENDVNDDSESIKAKKEGYQCTCGSVFQRKSRLETCLRSHNLVSDTDSCFSCQTCSKQFTDKNELALHRRRIHRKRFPCKFCPTDYNTRKDLFKHLQIHQKVQLMEYKVISEVMKGKQKLKCFMCAKTCSELSELKCHVMEDHKEPYTCPHCEGTFPKIIDFGNHTKTFHPEVEGQSVLDVLEAFSKLVKAWKCEECELQFHEADKLALHQVEKHSPELKTESQFQCDDCRRVFVSQKGLTSHRRVHHDSMEETEPVEQGIMCIECRKICKDETALTSHMRFHSPERKYPCRYCDFRFATPEKRKAHAEIHTGDMKFVCFICEYQCSSENRLNQHKMSLKHLNMREILRTGVPLVPEESTSSKKEKSKDTSKKKRSDKKKDDEEESSLVDEYACDICGDKFPSETEMLDHKQTHPFIEFPNEDTPTRIFFK